jgi:hypothetical protein
MIVKKTNQLGNFKKGINLYVPRKRISAAPTTLPLSTPNLYFSGLTFVPNEQYRNGNFINPYQKQSDTLWRAQNQSFGRLFFSQNYWLLRVNMEVYDEEYGSWIPYDGQAAYCASNGSSIPLIGWQYGGSGFTVNGTLVISTTP